MESSERDASASNPILRTWMVTSKDRTSDRERSGTRASFPSLQELAFVFRDANGIESTRERKNASKTKRPIDWSVERRSCV